MPLRVVEGASKFIEGASLYKTFTTALRARECHRRWLITVVLILLYDADR